MSRSLTQKLKQSIARNKQTKITFNAPVNVQDLINDYLEYYSDVEAERINPDLLISNIVESALNGEKDFQKWRRESNKDNGNMAARLDEQPASSLPLK
jgi:hypothetical protein